MNTNLSTFFHLLSIAALVCVVQLSPVKENPPRPSILQPSDQFLPPSVPLYLPDPERNKSKDDFYLLATYPQDAKNENGDPTKIVISLDSYARPPPIPDFQDSPINEQLQQAEKDKVSYSYNDRYDYYFPVSVVYDSKEKYSDKEAQLMEMQPPIQSNEPNYYAVKPKKLPKKYQPNKKDTNAHKKPSSSEEELVPIDNDGLVLDDEESRFVTSQPVERFAPAPQLHQLSDDDLNTGEYIPEHKHERNTEAISSQPEATGVGSEKIERQHSEKIDNFGLNSAKKTEV